MIKTKQVLAAMVLSVLATLAQAAGTLDKIRRTGTITLGVRESSGALAYSLGNGQYVGFHTQMAHNIAADLQKHLGLEKLQLLQQSITSQNRVPLMVGGTIDLECGTTTNDLSRQKDVAFAHTTYIEQVRIAVRADSGIADVADLAGRTVATTTGTTSVQLLRQHRRSRGVDFKNVLGRDHADSFALLESGRADAFVMDASILMTLISRSRSPQNFRLLDIALSTEPIACMMRKNDPEFLAAVNASIARQVQDGTLEKLYEQWFMQPIPPLGQKIGLPLNEATRNAWRNPNSLPRQAYR